MFGHLLDSPRTTSVASVISLTLGLFFTFVWAPHPWTWEGIDQYHDLARAVARGDGFRTTDVPWGYAYYIAAFYTIFGEHPVLPILGQVLANATMPFILFALVRPLAGQRTAALSALIVGAFSFNTVYASTQISDAVCSVLFLAAVLAFARGHQSGRLSYFAISGALAGLVPQFRPNLLLLPPLVAVLYFFCTSRRRLAPVALFVAISTLALVPWVARNYALAGVFLPTSSHGGIQLWYGSLQIGRYLENYSANPRTAFAPPAFDYTSLAGKSIVVSADLAECAPSNPSPPVTLVYWTDRQPNPITLPPSTSAGRSRQFDIPGQADPTAVYWRFDPVPGPPPPFVYFVSGDHLGDLDRHDDWLDIFDLARLARYLAWQDAIAGSGWGDLDGNGHVDQGDLSMAITRLLGATHTGASPLESFNVDRDGAVLRLSDGSRVRVPRRADSRWTDLEVEGALGRALVSARAPTKTSTPGVPAPTDACQVVGRVRVNDVFYRRELQQMQRYTALALDNITREPAAFAAAAAYRVVRLFVVRPTGDLATTYQFAWGPLVYAGGLVLSLSYFLVFLAGVVLAWRKHSALLPLLVPIVYVPATICFVLTNQRYTVTMQPLMFAFVAFAIVTALRWDHDADHVGINL